MSDLTTITEIAAEPVVHINIHDQIRRTLAVEHGNLS
jgi:hypothetical protein